MAFELPALPYDYDALAPFMSKETLEFHHDKHHQAYVTNGNKLLEGTGLGGKCLEEIVKGSSKNAGLFNNAGQHYNHIHFWKWMKPGGGGNKIPGALEGDRHDLGGYDKFKADFVAGRHRHSSARAGAWIGVKDGKLEITKTPNGENPARPRRARRSSAAMCGSTPTTSTIATAAPTISTRSSTA